jgi:hypothetical protein
MSTCKAVYNLIQKLRQQRGQTQYEDRWATDVTHWTSVGQKKESVVSAKVASKYLKSNLSVIKTYTAKLVGD